MALAGSIHTNVCQVGLTYPESPVQSRWQHPTACAIPLSWNVTQGWLQCDRSVPHLVQSGLGSLAVTLQVLWSLQLQREAKVVTS